MKLLAIETSGRVGSVALQDEDRIDERIVPTPRDQTAFVLQYAHELLASAGVGLQALDAIVFGRGPGSFTGIRLAVAVAQGLAVAQSLRLVGISSLAAMAQSAWRQQGIERALVCVDARMGEVYWGEFAIDDGIARNTRPERIGPPDSVELPSGTDWAGVGDGFATFPDLAGRASGARLLAGFGPSAADLLPAAVAAVAAGETMAPEDAKPAYLRGKSAWRREFNGSDLTKLQ